MEDKGSLADSSVVHSVENPAFLISMMNLQDKLQKASTMEGEKFAALQEQLQSSLLDAAFEDGGVA